MRRPTYLYLLASIFAAVLLAALAACGGASPTSSAGAGSSASPAPIPTVQTRTVVVGGASETVLTDASGKTLYYFTLDTSTRIACSGSCASIWPPLLTPSGTPTSAAGLPGALGVVDGANGKQDEYNGHPLYTFAHDTQPGQANGNGVLGKWFVATPNLTSQAISAGSGY